MMINRKALKYFIPVVIIIVNAGTKLIEANFNYQDIRDPFHSVVEEDEKWEKKTAEEEKDKKAIREMEGVESKEEKKVMLGLIEKEMSDKLEKLEISGFFGENKKYFVLFKGDNRIYKEKDRLNMDKNIKIDGIDVDLVNLEVDLGNGKRLFKKILFKIK